MTEDEIAAAVRAVQAGEAPGHVPDVEAGYAIQQAMCTAGLVAGRRLVGHRVTVAGAPLAGHLFEDMALGHGDVALGVSEAMAEIGIELRAPLRGRVTREQVLLATRAVRPALGLFLRHVLRHDAEPAALVACNLGARGFVLGDGARDPRHLDLRWVGAIMLRDGEVVETGLGAAVLNDPLEAVVWLSAHLATHGQGLKPGQIVLVGGLTRAVACPPGSHIAADFGDLGSVEITLG